MPTPEKTSASLCPRTGSGRFGWHPLTTQVGGGSADNLLLLDFKSDALRPLVGKTLAEVAAMRGTPTIDTMMDLVVEDDSRVGTAYFLMSEDNVRRQIRLPWVSFGSDAEASEASTHPRAQIDPSFILWPSLKPSRVA